MQDVYVDYVMIMRTGRRTQETEGERERERERLDVSNSEMGRRGEQIEEGTIALKLWIDTVGEERHKERTRTKKAANATGKKKQQKVMHLL